MDAWIFILFSGLKFSTIIIRFITQIIPALAIGNSFKLAFVFF